MRPGSKLREVALGKTEKIKKLAQPDARKGHGLVYIRTDVERTAGLPGDPQHAGILHAETVLV